MGLVSRDESRERALALLARIDETLSRPRPPEDARWKAAAPVEALSGPLRMTNDQMLDTVARGVALALKDATDPLLARIEQLETNTHELSQAVHDLTAIVAAFGDDEHAE